MHTKSYFEFLIELYIKHDASTESQYIPEENHCFQIWPFPTTRTTAVRSGAILNDVSVIEK